MGWRGRQKNWGDSRSGKRKGAPVGFPRFKSKHRTRLSCRFTTGAIRCETKHAVLPRLGRIKMHEDAAGLASLVDAGAARVLSAVVRFERGRWFVSFTVDMARPALTPARPDAVVGVDLGIKTLAVLSTGEQIPNLHTPTVRHVRSPGSPGRCPAESARTIPRPRRAGPRLAVGGQLPLPWLRLRVG